MNNVTIIKSSKRRTVSISIEPDASIKVTIPSYFFQWQVKKILEEKSEWIHSAQQKVLARQKEVAQEGLYFYLGKQYHLSHKPGQKELVEFSDKLYVASSNNTYIKTYLTSWYKQQARKIISERVYHYAKIAGLSFKSIAITTAETRWGSCSSNKTLNFNWKLVMAPMEVIDYVVTHELAHLTELNHSQAFWETVRQMYPLYREYRTWLRRYGHLLTV